MVRNLPHVKHHKVRTGLGIRRFMLSEGSTTRRWRIDHAGQILTHTQLDQLRLNEPGITHKVRGPAPSEVPDPSPQSMMCRRDISCAKYQRKARHQQRRQKVQYPGSAAHMNVRCAEFPNLAQQLPRSAQDALDVSPPNARRRTVTNFLEVRHHHKLDATPFQFSLYRVTGVFSANQEADGAAGVLQRGKSLNVCPLLPQQRHITKQHQNARRSAHSFCSSL